MATALQHMTECPICYEPFTGPKILPCGHSLCTACVNGIQRESRIKCPMCNVSHDADKVRVDFRLNQFLDAIKEKQEGGETSTQVKGSSSKTCELCTTNPVTFFCEDCQQWICTVCKNVHLKSKVCKDHKVTPLTLKNQEVKNTFETESRKVKGKIDEFSEILTTIQTKAAKIDSTKTESLQISGKLKQQSLEDVHKFFDAFDSKIVDFAQRNSDDLQAEKLKTEDQLEDLKSQWNQLEEMVKENADELAVKTGPILERAKSLVKSTGNFNTEMSDMRIQVEPGKTWDPSSAATLQLRTAGMKVASCHSTKRKLSELSESTWRKDQEVSLDHSPKALRLIKQELWSCQDGGNIQIFDQYIEHQRNICNKEWGNVYDVAVMPNNELVLACSNGLFHIQPNGEQLNKIENGFYSSAIYQENKIYTYTCNPARICSFVLDGEWRKDGTINLRCGDWHFVTLSVTGKRIMAAYAYEGNIYDISLHGEITDRHGKRGDGQTDGCLGLPFLCQNDKDGTLLTADFDNHRLLVLDNKGNWKGVTVEPRLVYPRGAVYTGHTLYVASTGRIYTLSAYTQE